MLQFDHFVVGMFLTRDDHQAGDATEDDIQDAHMAHLAGLHDAGLILAAGPTDDAKLRGLVLFACDVEEARRCMEADPAVQAGWFSVELVPWMVPRGALRSSPARFPRSMAELG